MTTAGEMRERIVLSAYEGVDDGYGNVTGGWVDKATVAARIRPLVGHESVLAGRLQGVQPYVITVRHSPDTAAATTDWRATNARTDTLYAIKSIINPDERRAFLDLLVEEGVAA